MSETTRVVIPYESMDPLAIGATDDESKKHRDTLEVDIPRPASSRSSSPTSRRRSATRPRRTCGARSADERADVRRAPAGQASVAVVIDNQFRPTPSSKLLPAVFDAIDAAGVTDVRVCCANGKVFPMSESDTEQKVGRENLARMEERLVVLAERPAEPRRVHVRRRVVRWHAVWLLNEVASADLKITIGQAQANHWGAGGGGKLIPGRRLGRDRRVEPLRVRHLAADALRRVRRPDALGHRRGRVDVRARLHDERAPRHARARDRRDLRLHPEAHREAIRRFNEIYAYESFVPEHGQADIAICGVFAPTDHLFFHTGWGCMSADLVVKDGARSSTRAPRPASRPRSATSGASRSWT